MPASYQTLLVRAEAGDQGAAALRCAAVLADAMGSLVIGLGAEPTEARTATALSPADAEQFVARRDAVESDLRAAEQAFTQAMGARRTLWRSRRLAPETVLAEAGRTADLIIVGSAAGGPRRSANTRLIMTAGRPVLIAPDHGQDLRARAILVAWSDTRESRRALSDALPLLQAADDVLVLQIATAGGRGQAEDAVSDVAAALVGRGVRARADVGEGDPRDAAAMICERARWMGADVVVAGAFGHGPMTELILGGVTESLLRQQDLFVLFSH